MLGKALARGREPHASSLGLDQLRAGFVCQGGDLLRHARCGDRQDVAGVVTAASEPSTWPSRQLSPEIQVQFTKRWLRNDPEHVVHRRSVQRNCSTVRPSDGRTCNGRHSSAIGSDRAENPIALG